MFKKQCILYGQYVITKTRPITNLENIFGTQRWIIHKMLCIMRKRVCGRKIGQGNEERTRSKCPTASKKGSARDNQQYAKECEVRCHGVMVTWQHCRLMAALLQGVRTWHTGRLWAGSLLGYRLAIPASSNFSCLGPSHRTRGHLSLAGSWR